MYHDRAELERAFQAKTPLNFLFFWGHQPSKDGKITSACLSQWWPSPFEVEGVIYPTAEHWMMSQKARLFGDEQTACRILTAESPKEVKQLGREAEGFDAAIWDGRKIAIVEEGSFCKFSQNSGLRDYLTSTGDRILVEASPVDRIWGIGLAADDTDAINPSRWRGENLLGFALMGARQRLLA
jgi:ribA/ribD-fused uncharacterized protein